MGIYILARARSLSGSRKGAGYTGCLTHIFLDTGTLLIFIAYYCAHGRTGNNRKYNSDREAKNKECNDCDNYSNFPIVVLHQLIGEKKDEKNNPTNEPDGCCSNAIFAGQSRNVGLR